LEILHRAAPCRNVPVTFTLSRMGTVVIVALDFDTEREATSLVERLGSRAAAYKVGLQTLTSVGPKLVRTLVASGKQVFLDLKLYEIPNSVAGAVRAAGSLGVSLVTVHASAGSAVLKAAVQAARPYPQLRILGLTVITSLADADLPEVGLAPSVEQQVRRLAALASAAGCHGVVASVREASFLRESLPPNALVVCPGIQLPESGDTDQVRVATPAAAVRAGATHIVVGRAISAAADPVAAYEAIVGACAHEA
jgi:orotidine-5'-phosphate decarboxylase